MELTDLNLISQSKLLLGSWLVIMRSCLQLLEINVCGGERNRDCLAGWGALLLLSLSQLLRTTVKVY